MNSSDKTWIWLKLTIKILQGLSTWVLTSTLIGLMKNLISWMDTNMLENKTSQKQLLKRLQKEMTIKTGDRQRVSSQLLKTKENVDLVGLSLLSQQWNSLNISLLTSLKIFLLNNYLTAAKYLTLTVVMEVKW